MESPELLVQLPTKTEAFIVKATASVELLSQKITAPTSIMVTKSQLDIQVQPSTISIGPFALSNTDIQLSIGTTQRFAISSTINVPIKAIESIKTNLTIFKVGKDTNCFFYAVVPKFIGFGELLGHTDNDFLNSFQIGYPSVRYSSIPIPAIDGRLKAGLFVNATFALVGKHQLVKTILNAFSKNAKRAELPLEVKLASVFGYSSSSPFEITIPIPFTESKGNGWKLLSPLAFTAKAGFGMGFTIGFEMSIRGQIPVGAPTNAIAISGAISIAYSNGMPTADGTLALETPWLQVFGIKGLDLYDVHAYLRLNLVMGMPESIGLRAAFRIPTAGVWEFSAMYSVTDLSFVLQAKVERIGTPQIIAILQQLGIISRATAEQLPSIELRNFEATVALRDTYFANKKFNKGFILKGSLYYNDKMLAFAGVELSSDGFIAEAGLENLSLLGLGLRKAEVKIAIASQWQFRVHADFSIDIAFIHYSQQVTVDVKRDGILLSLSSDSWYLSIEGTSEQLAIRGGLDTTGLNNLINLARNSVQAIRKRVEGLRSVKLQLEQSRNELTRSIESYRDSTCSVVEKLENVVSGFFSLFWGANTLSGTGNAKSISFSTILDAEMDRMIKFEATKVARRMKKLKKKQQAKKRKIIKAITKKIDRRIKRAQRKFDRRMNRKVHYKPISEQLLRKVANGIPRNSIKRNRRVPDRIEKLNKKKEKLRQVARVACDLVRKDLKKQFKKEKRKTKKRVLRKAKKNTRRKLRSLLQFALGKFEQHPNKTKRMARRVEKFGTATHGNTSPAPKTLANTLLASTMCRAAFNFASTVVDATGKTLETVVGELTEVTASILQYAENLLTFDILVERVAFSADYKYASWSGALDLEAIVRVGNARIAKRISFNSGESWLTFAGRLASTIMSK